MRKNVLLVILTFCLIVASSLSLMACDLLGGGGNKKQPDNGNENVGNGGDSSDINDGPTIGEVKDLVLNSIQSKIDLHQENNYSLTVSMNGAVNKGSFDVVCDGLTYHSFLKENDDFVDAYFAYTSETGGQRVVFYATGTNTDGTNRYAQRTDTGSNPAAIVFTMIEENVGKSLYNLFTEVMTGENCSITKDSEKIDVNILLL